MSLYVCMYVCNMIYIWCVWKCVYICMCVVYFCIHVQYVFLCVYMSIWYDCVHMCSMYICIQAVYVCCISWYSCAMCVRVCMSGLYLNCGLCWTGFINRVAKQIWFWGETFGQILPYSSFSKQKVECIEVLCNNKFLYIEVEIESSKNIAFSS